MKEFCKKITPVKLELLWSTIRKRILYNCFHLPVIIKIINYLYIIIIPENIWNFNGILYLNMLIYIKTATNMKIKYFFKYSYWIFKILALFLPVSNDTLLNFWFIFILIVVFEGNKNKNILNMLRMIFNCFNLKLTKK